MLVEKSNLLQRVRVVMIALVAVIGFGTMAMKPVDPPFSHRYGVAETANGENWEIKQAVTDPGSPYTCDASSETCVIGSNTELNVNDQIPINQSLALEPGTFIPL